MVHQPCTRCSISRKHALHATCVHAKSPLGMNTLQHASIAYCSVFRQLVACFICSLCVCVLNCLLALHITQHVLPTCCSFFRQPTTCFLCNSCVPITFMSRKSCLCICLVATMILYLAQAPLIDVTTSHGIALMTSHPHAKGIVSLCQPLDIFFELASLILHRYALSKSILVLQRAMALCSWITKTPLCTRHYALVGVTLVIGHL